MAVILPGNDNPCTVLLFLLRNCHPSIDVAITVYFTPNVKSYPNIWRAGDGGMMRWMVGGTVMRWRQRTYVDRYPCY